jgi:hypothetical protein
MSWTNIPNGNLAVGAPIRSVDQLALRDNPIAIAEGATGAPRVRAEALNGGQSGTAPIYAARAWVNFDGTGTVAIRASGNVSSITDNGTGNYTVNFTTAMVDTNYSVNGLAKVDSTATLNERALSVYSITTTSFIAVTHTGAPAITDSAFVFVAVFR